MSGWLKDESLKQESFWMLNLKYLDQKILKKLCFHQFSLKFQSLFWNEIFWAEIPLDLSNLHPMALKGIRKVSRDPITERKIENSSESVLTLIESLSNTTKTIFFYILKSSKSE